MQQQTCTRLTTSTVKRLLFLRIAVIAIAAVFLATATYADEEPPEITHDGLHLLQDSQLAVVWAKPDIDLSVYNKILILELYVAFDSSWERDQGRRVSGNARNNIKQSVVAEFNAAFREELEVRGGYPIVEEPGEDVMIIRPAVIDLIVNATDQQTAGRSTTCVTNTGSAMLFAEIFDSESGDILARALDRQAGRRRGGRTCFRGGAAVNRADARAIFAEWASTLRERLDLVHDRFSED